MAAESPTLRGSARLLVKHREQVQTTPLALDATRRPAAAGSPLTARDSEKNQPISPGKQLSPGAPAFVPSPRAAMFVPSAAATVFIPQAAAEFTGPAVAATQSPPVGKAWFETPNSGQDESRTFTASFSAVFPPSSLLVLWICSG